MKVHKKVGGPVGGGSPVCVPVCLCVCVFRWGGGSGRMGVRMYENEKLKLL